MFGRALGQLFMAVCGLVLALPIIVVAGASLNGGEPCCFHRKTPFFAVRGIFRDRTIWVRALQNSIMVAFWLGCACGAAGMAIGLSALGAW